MRQTLLAILVLSCLGLSACFDVESLKATLEQKEGEYQATMELLTNMQHSSEAEGGILECLKDICLLHDSAVDLVRDITHGSIVGLETHLADLVDEATSIAQDCNPIAPATFEAAVDDFAPSQKEGLLETFATVLESQKGDSCLIQVINLVPTLNTLSSALRSQDFEQILSEIDSQIVPMSKTFSTCLDELPSEVTELASQAISALDEIPTSAESQCIYLLSFIS